MREPQISTEIKEGKLYVNIVEESSVTYEVEATYRDEGLSIEILADIINEIIAYTKKDKNSPLCYVYDVLSPGEELCIYADSYNNAIYDTYNILLTVLSVVNVT